eukprot:TRINITY_DN5944_c0_g1_i2.p1 TRINITY_DN5944_c0_g1~~TRINITY_DN5944_c0_g1_i2.p1  ORF type:complete len:316 (+),score=50.51 TRINITY_DN5944_c0_g1_i2:43-948(+)
MASHSLIPVVDAHQHLWDLDKFVYGWLNGPDKLDRLLAGDLDPIRHNYLLDDYLADCKNQNVVKSVHLQSECDDEVGETKWLQQIADKHGFPHAIVARVNLTAPNLRESLDEMRTCPNMRGIRQQLNWNDEDASMRACKEDYLKNEAWFKGLETLQEYGYSFDIHVWYHQLAEAAAIVARLPKMQFIVNHTGFPVNRDEATYQAWREGMQKMATNPNAAVKISGLVVTDHHWTVESLRPYVLGTIEIFGVDRCMFASNYPVDKLVSDYDSIFNAYRELVKDFSPADQLKLFHDNACKYYRI